jgi:hypothetical protein
VINIANIWRKEATYFCFRQASSAVGPAAHHEVSRRGGGGQSQPVLHPLLPVREHGHGAPLPLGGQAPALPTEYLQAIPSGRCYSVRMILPDPDRDPVMKAGSVGDPDPDPYEKRRFLLFCNLFYDFLSLKNDVNVPVFQIRIRRIRMFLVLPDPHPDPYQNVTEPQHCQVLIFTNYRCTKHIFLCNITNLLWPFSGKMFRIPQDPDPQHCKDKKTNNTKLTIKNVLIGPHQNS